eukprot:4979568-Alexandrium_andersonii.AAC.1
MSASLVGSEMCIRDRMPQDSFAQCRACVFAGLFRAARPLRVPGELREAPCLLYTSDAADDM